MTREGDRYKEVVGPYGGKGGPRRIWEEMPPQKGDLWGGGHARREVLEHHLVSMVHQKGLQKSGV